MWGSSYVTRRTTLFFHYAYLSYGVKKERNEKTDLF
jgi:hypothetical protein